MSERRELTEYKSSLPCVADDSTETLTDKIRIRDNKGYREIFKTLAAYWRFAALTAAFAIILMTLYFVFFCDTVDSEDNECSVDENILESATSDTEAGDADSVDEIFTPPTVINEALVDMDFDKLWLDSGNSEEYFLSSTGINVLIIHSHTSEMVSESMSVLDAGEAISKLLAASQISAVHHKEKYDDDGRVGAYERMKTSIYEIKDIFPELILVIDLHGSDDEYPFSLNIGTSTVYAWKENLRIASMLYNTMERKDCAIRLLPQSLGQDNGVLTLNVSIGNENTDDKYSRELISQVASGIIKLFKESTSE